MIRKLFIIFLLFAGLQSCGGSDPTQEKMPANPSDIVVRTGMNLVGKVTYSDGTPSLGVVVSDGVSVTKTDQDGIYQMARAENAKFVYISIPAQSKIPVAADGTPAFYSIINQSHVVFRKDFTLTKLGGGVESKFNLYCIADPQVDNTSNIDRFVNETVADIKKSLVKGEANYAITLGDVVFDRPALMNSIKSAMVSVGMPIFQVIGNHDHNETKLTDAEAIVNFQHCFGPVNYSFNRANAHIVAMDNVMYSKKQTYSTGFTNEQIEWLKQDLAAVEKDKLLIVCMHIPLRNNTYSITNGTKFYDLIKQFKESHIMSGHTHYNQNVVTVGSNIYEHIHGAACGAWWSGTINGDATPNGYGIYNISGNKMANWRYKSTNMPAEFQIWAYPQHSFGDASDDIIANIWNADNHWTVELYENGVKTADMLRYTDYDKAAWMFFQSMGKPVPTPNATTGWFRRPDHLYRAVPASPSSKIEIRATDIFGNVYRQDKLLTNTDVFGKYMN